ncbi:MAG TPA: AAA family ATPase, partial [Isosphaeraceae bacterium]
MGQGRLGTDVRAGLSADGGPGTRLFDGRFRGTRVLKRAPGRETWLGADLEQGGLVVIKALAVGAVSAGARMRLEHEADVLQQARSPWVAPVLHLGRADDLLFLVTPLVHGVTLRERLDRGPLSVRDTLTVGLRLMAGLRDVHEHRVLHRALSPASLIVDEVAPLHRATLIDFGLAWCVRLDAAPRDRWLETARYTSPEQAGLLDHDVDERSDLYAAGVVLFECLAGRPPFPGRSVGEVLRQHLTLHAPELRSLGAAVPRALDEVLQRLLRKDPRDRYQSAEAVLADLEAIVAALDRGLAEPSLVVGLHDRRRTLTEPAFVGRGGELAALEAQLDRAHQGSGGLVLLESESGGGKTRLLDELARAGARRGAWVLRGHGLDQAAEHPFQILFGVGRDLIELARQDPEVAAELRRRLGEQCPATGAALPELAAILGGETAGWLGPETFGETRSLQALTALLDALGDSPQPVLMLLDDCQWADELTRKLLVHWNRRQDQRLGALRRLLLVVAFRSEEVPRGDPLLRLEPAAHVVLPPFSPEDVRRLAESMAGPLPAEILEVVEHFAGGSPFLASAVLRGLVESGALVADPAGGWRVEPLAMADVQSSRHAAAVLARRFELLPAAAVRLLSVGAILGKEFDLDFTATLAGQLPHEAIAALDEARRRQIVWAKAQETRCVFIHDQLRQVLLDRLPPEELRGLHQRAALYLEALDPRRVFDLAYHFDAAGESHRALPYALTAAERARSQHSLEIAEQQYRIAARGAPGADDDTAYRIAEGLGEVLMLRGRYDEAAAQFQAADRLARDVAARAQIQGKLGELAFKRGEVARAGAAIERALRHLGQPMPRSPAWFLVLLAREVAVQLMHTSLPGLFLARRRLEGAERERIAIRLYSRLCHAYWFGRGWVVVLWAHLRGMNLAERYPPTLELAQAYSEHAPAMSLISNYRRALAYAERSLAIRKELGDPWSQGQSLHYYGVVLYAASRFSECIETCREAVRLLERTGDRWEVNTARYQIAASLYRLGDLRGAVAEARRIHRLGLDLGDAQASGISLDVWARAAGGRVPAETIQEELRRPGTNAQITGEVMLAEAVRLLGAGRPGEAARVLEAAQRIVQEAGVHNTYVAPILPWLATARRREAEATPAWAPRRRRALLRRAQAALNRGLRAARRWRNDLPHALREGGLLAALRGRARRSRRLLDRSLAEAERQGARYEAAQTLLARGRIGSTLGWPGAEEDLAAAHQALHSLGAELAWDEAAADRPTSPTVTLSLVDRFDTVLDAGRRIASALSPE